MITVAAPSRVWQRLATAVDGPRTVVHASRHAVYVDLDGDCVGLVSAAASRVPCALWAGVPDLGLAGITGRRAHVATGALVLDGVRLRAGRVVDVHVPPLHTRRRAARLSWTALPQVTGLDLPEDGRLTPRHVADLVGRGPGLTPLGDDVLAGWLATRVAAGAPDHAVADAVRRARGATTSLSASLLDCAVHGEALPQLRAWLAAAGTPAEEAATAALLDVGATSGAGLLAGAWLALRSLAPSGLGLHDEAGRVA